VRCACGRAHAGRDDVGAGEYAVNRDKARRTREAHLGHRWALAAMLSLVAACARSSRLGSTTYRSADESKRSMACRLGSA